MPVLCFEHRQVLRIILISTLLLLQTAGIGVTRVFSFPDSHNKGLHKNSLAKALLRDAKIAQEAGQIERAQCLWLQIQKLYPQQSKPAWLQTDQPKVLSVSTNDRQNLLLLASNTTDPTIKASLESLIKANPLDKEVRNALLSMAQRQGDSVAELRHKSIFQPVARPCKTQTLKLFLAVAIVAAIFWCLFSASPGSKTADKPEGEPLWREIVSSAKDFIKRRYGHK